MDQQLQSYLGILSHATQAQLSQALMSAYWVRNPPSPSNQCNARFYREQAQKLKKDP